MTLAPGSLPWLLAWDLRVRLRGIRLRRAAVGWQLLVATLLHGLCGTLVWQALQHPMGAGAVLVLCERLLALLAPGLLMFALLATLRTLLAAGEMGLLLLSPLPFARLYAVRVLSSALGTWGVGLVFLAPVANMGALLGEPRFLLVYPVSLLLAATVTGLALLLMTACVAGLGVHEARRWLRRLQAVVPVALVGLALLSSSAPGAWAGPLGSAFRVPARALMGDAPSLAALALVAGVTLGSGAALSARPAARSLREPEEAGRFAAAPAPARTFRGGVFRLLAEKEWKTILRDLRLSSSLMIQPMLALAMLVVRILDGRLSAAGLAAGATFSAAFISQQLSNLAVSAEEMPALLASSPQPWGRIVRYKCIAVLMPVWILLAPCALWVARRDAWLGLVTYVCLLGASFAAATLEVARPYAVPRRSFVRSAGARRRGGLDMLVIFLLPCCWGGGAWLIAQRNAFAAAVLAVGILIPLITWMRSRTTPMSWME